MFQEESLTLEPRFVGFVQGTTQLVHAKMRQMQSCGVRSIGNIARTLRRPILKEQECQTHSINKQDTIREVIKIREPIKIKGTKIRDILIRESLG